MCGLSEIERQEFHVPHVFSIGTAVEISPSTRHGKVRRAVIKNIIKHRPYCVVVMVDGCKFPLTVNKKRLKIIK